MLSRGRVLQFSPELSVLEEWFSEYELSVFGGQNSIDMQNIPRARDGIRRWMHFYNHRRKHQALEKRTPYTLYYENLNSEARASA